MEKEEFVIYAKQIENEIYLTMRKDINKKIEKLYDYMITNFKKDFFYDEGLPRIWNKMEETTIDKLYEQNKIKHMQTFDIFKKISLVKNPMECKLVIILDINYSSQNKEVNLNSIDIESEQLMNEQDFAFMKRRYDEGINEILEDAKRRHVY